MSDRRKRMTSDALILLVGASAGKGIAQIYMVISARSLGAESFAALALGISIAQILADGILFHNGNVIVRAASAETSSAALIRWGAVSNRRGLLLGCVVLVSGCAVAFTAPGSWTIGVLASAAFLPLAGLRIASAALLASGSNRQRIVYSDLLAPVCILFFLPACYFAFNAFGFGVAYCVGSLVAFLVMCRNLAFGERLSPEEDARINESFSSSGGLRSFARSTYAISNLNNLTRWGDTLLVGVLLGVSDTAVYAAVAVIPLVVDTFTVRVAALSAAEGARVADRVGRSQLGALFAESSSAALAMAVPMCAVIVAAASPILVILYGDSFEVGAPILRVLILAGLVRASFSGDSPVLLSADGHRHELGNSLFSALVTLSLSVVGAVGFGLMGFVIGRLIGEFISRYARYLVVERLIGVRIGIMKSNLIAYAEVVVIGVGGARAGESATGSPVVAACVSAVTVLALLAVVDRRRYQFLWGVIMQARPGK